MSFWGVFTPPSTPKFCWGWLIWAPNIAYESLLRWWKKTPPFEILELRYLFFCPKTTFFECRGVLNPPRVPKFCQAWLIWSPTPACMSTLWFGKKIQPSYRIWFIFFYFFVSHPVFSRYLAHFWVPQAKYENKIFPFGTCYRVSYIGCGLSPKLTLVYEFRCHLRFFSSPWLNLTNLTIFLNFEPGEVLLGKSDRPKCRIFLNYTSQRSKSHCKQIIKIYSFFIGFKSGLLPR